MIEDLNFDIILQGIPAVSDRGALGWCTVALIRCRDKKILIDTGSNGDRGNLLRGLRELGIGPEDINYVILTHLHYDHCQNLEIFPNAKVFVCERELEYVLSKEYKKFGDPYIPYVYITAMHEAGRLQTVTPESYIECFKFVHLPGHTPGSCGIIYNSEDGTKVIFTGDALKNAWDYLNNKLPPSFSPPGTGRDNYKKIFEISKLVVPGHDRPFYLDDEGRVNYLTPPTILTIKFTLAEAEVKNQWKI